MVDKKGKIVGIRPDLEIDDDGNEIIEPDTDLIEMLQLLLDQAKEGDLQEVCFTLRYSNLVTTSSGFAGMPLNSSGMLGEIMRLQRRYHDWIDEVDSYGNEDEDDDEE